MNISSRAWCQFGFAAVIGCAPHVVLAEGGEDAPTAVAIPALPFADAGDTSDNVDDWDEVCPYSFSIAPDVWYQYSPADDISIDVVLCESGYDTKTYVLDTGFVQVACNDDACSSSGGGGFRSILADVALLGGQTYFIVVDGYLDESGAYDLVVDETSSPPPCISEECSGTPEGEPCDDSGAPDTLNGGCNSTPAVFSDVNCGETICGTLWASAAARDTDWYAVGIPGDEAGVTVTVTAEAPVEIFLLTGIENDLCIDPVVVNSTLALPCEETSVTWGYVVDQPYFMIMTSELDVIPCGDEEPGNDYVLDVTCGPACGLGPPCCERGNPNQDSLVDFADLIIVLDNWGECPGKEGVTCCEYGDVTENGHVGFGDLIVVLNYWGEICCGLWD